MSTKIRRGLAAARPFLIYGVSIALGKGLSLLTLPLLAHQLPQAEFVRLDFAASIIEPLGLLAGFSLADTLFRFGQGEEARDAMLGRLVGICLALAATMIAASQFLLIPLLEGHQNLPGIAALRLILLSACLGGLIELPLAFLRLSGRPGLFLGFVAFRAIAQAVSLVASLAAGLGVDAILIGNALVDFAIIAGLLVSLPKKTRITLDLATLRQALPYAGPLLLGGLAMFALGACDRWFLAGKVPSETLAQYALAAKLALALALATQPFALWWYPRRLGILQSAGGEMETARFWTLGILIIGGSAIAVMAVARILIVQFMPGSYLGALALLPALLAATCLNEIASLTNGVAHAREKGWLVLRTNAAGAFAAVALYLLLIPVLDLTGAIIATLAGQGLRVFFFVQNRHEGKAIPYPLLRAAIFLGFCFQAIFFLSLPVSPDFAALTLLTLVLAVAIGLLARQVRAPLQAGLAS